MKPLQKHATSIARWCRSTGIRFVAYVLCAAFVCSPVVLAAPVPTEKPVNYPNWWFEREVVARKSPQNGNPAWPNDYAIPNDYAAANLGQLKQIATQAAEELNAYIPGGAGPEINALIYSWSVAPITGVARDDYSAINLGQLKAVAKLFYDRLVGAFFLSSYPWSNAQPNDYAIANLGQLKNVFSFDVFTDSDWDGLPDIWEITNSLKPNDARDADLISYAGALTNREKFQMQLNPNGADSDGDGVSDAQELINGSDPKLKDSDGNGVPDNEEIYLLYDRQYGGGDMPGDLPNTGPYNAQTTRYLAVIADTTFSGTEAFFETNVYTTDPITRKLTYTRTGNILLDPFSWADNFSETATSTTTKRSVTFYSGIRTIENMEIGVGYDPDIPDYLRTVITKSSPYTYDQLKVDSRALIPAFTNAFGRGDSDAGQHNELFEIDGWDGYFYARIHYKFRREAGFKDITVNWLEVFVPDDIPDTAIDESQNVEVELKTWTGADADQKESTVYLIDPQTKKPDVAGTFYVHPVDIAVRKKGTTAAPDDGLIVNKTDILEIALAPNWFDQAKQFETLITWQYQQLKSDGTYTGWTAFGADGKGTKFEYTTPTGGVFQLKAIVAVAGQQQEYKLLRKKDDARNGEKVGLGKKGLPDAFGVVDADIQIAVRNSAQINLGSHAYDPITSWPPSFLKDSDKCNLFVAHKATDAGATVPWINGNNPFVPYPPTANQWAGTDPKNIPNWVLLPVETMPQPGFVVAEPNELGSGHCGILDYDGRGIAAGTLFHVSKIYNFFQTGPTTGRQRKYSP